jgi:gliding motility-associated-like protein
LNPEPVQLFVYGADDLWLKWSLNGGPATGLSNDTIHNPVAVIGATSEYVVTTPDLTGTCKASDTVVVYIDKTNNVTITPKNIENPENALVMCQPGYLQLEALLQGRPPKNNVACGIGNPTLCSNEDSATIYGSAVFGNVFHDTIGTVTPVLYNTLRTTRMQFLVRKAEFDAAGMFSSTIRGISFQTKGNTVPNHVYSNFRILIKCTEKEELEETEGFENFGLTQVYASPVVDFPDGEHYYTFSTPFNIDTTKNMIIQLCYSDNPTVDTGCGVTSAPPAISFVSTAYTSGLILKGKDAADISVCGIDKSSQIQALLGRPLFKFRYCEADPLEFVITWNHGEYLSDTTIAQPLAYVPKSASFIVEVVGRSNCIMRDTLEVYVPEHDMSIQPEDTSICLGDRAPFVIFGGTYFKWYEYVNGQYVVPSSVTEPTKGYTFLSPERTMDYRIVVSDSVWCYDTLSARVEILPLPDVRILNEDDTVVKYGQSFQLLASGARMYNWSPSHSLNNPNISYPIARPTEDTKYIVGGLAANGCRAFDTLHVIVDKRDNLFVPSAFSPNGDGKNDVFKVTNLSFQRIMEFRVFNRWGQEVFSTNDHRMGWDGSWEGKPQEMGVYTYLIRVAYPDGFVETYKGETTLIR